MRALSRIVLVALAIAAGFFLWQKYRPSPPPEVVTVAPAAVPPPPPPDLSAREWTDLNGRSFLGALVSVSKDQVILRRSADATHFQISAATLSEADQRFLQEQIRRAQESGQTFPDEIAGLHKLRRKVDIKGSIMRVPASELVGGWRNERSDPMFLFLVSSKLHDSEAGCAWVRVDEKTFRVHSEGVFLTDAQLGASALGEKSAWSRPDTTLQEASYGPHGQGVNITHTLMQLVSKGDLPVKISSDLFRLPSHAPATWEAHIIWRTANGEVRRILKDGDSLNWP